MATELIEQDNREECSACSNFTEYLQVAEAAAYPMCVDCATTGAREAGKELEVCDSMTCTTYTTNKRNVYGVRFCDSCREEDG